MSLKEMNGKHVRLREVLLVFTLLLGFAVPAAGQEVTIVRTFSDPTGAVIPNVAINGTKENQTLRLLLARAIEGGRAGLSKTL